MDNITLSINGYDVTYRVLGHDSLQVISIYDNHNNLVEYINVGASNGGEFFNLLKHLNDLE